MKIREWVRERDEYCFLVSFFKVKTVLISIWQLWPSWFTFKRLQFENRPKTVNNIYSWIDLEYWTQIAFWQIPRKHSSAHADTHTHKHFYGQSMLFSIHTHRSRLVFGKYVVVDSQIVCTLYGHVHVFSAQTCARLRNSCGNWLIQQSIGQCAYMRAPCAYEWSIEQWKVATVGAYFHSWNHNSSEYRQNSSRFCAIMMTERTVWVCECLWFICV